MTALKWITTEAKKLKKQYPKRFAKWTDYVSQASAIYASKHKGKSPVGKKKVGYSKERLDVVFRATPFIKKYKSKGFTKKEALKNANLDAAFMGSPKKKAAHKKPSEKSILNKIHKVKKDVDMLDEAQHKHMSIGAIKSKALHHYKTKYGHISTKKMLEKTKRGKAKLMKELKDIENKIKKIHSL
jgi:hypothetical protein